MLVRVVNRLAGLANSQVMGDGAPWVWVQLVNSPTYMADWF